MATGGTPRVRAAAERGWVASTTSRAADLRCASSRTSSLKTCFVLSELLLLTHTSHHLILTDREIYTPRLDATRASSFVSEGRREERERERERESQASDHGSDEDWRRNEKDVVLRPSSGPGVPREHATRSRRGRNDERPRREEERWVASEPQSQDRKPPRIVLPGDGGERGRG